MGEGGGRRRHASSKQALSARTPAGGFCISIHPRTRSLYSVYSAVRRSPDSFEQLITQDRERFIAPIAWMPFGHRHVAQQPTRALRTCCVEQQHPVRQVERLVQIARDDERGGAVRAPKRFLCQALAAPDAQSSLGVDRRVLRATLMVASSARRYLPVRDGRVICQLARQSQLAFFSVN
ncbi:hypothetical protein [Paraburkholderia fynbosensis]|uniref:Uncharacterized protein n=1 Tax=Paraburkholderia fynbosensis TaxID=1200993 RepID=A0A6J5FAS5_9BURK|nr:hypothetical protein [Paraburkholderia fynbosensis]CAB3775824.1 hypothetical protein LMG27177_00020 [Paraburkholderia fynbosensis]